MSKSAEAYLEENIRRVFALIDGQIQLSITNDDLLPFYDINEMLKLEYESCRSPLYLSIKFIGENVRYGTGCEINGNYFALLWMYKHKNLPVLYKDKKDNKIVSMQYELYDLWKDDYEELDEILIDKIDSLDAYTMINNSGEIHPLRF